MKIGDLFDRDARCAAGLRRKPVHGLQYDSRKIEAGDVFFAFPGEHVDGHKFVEAVLDAGAVAIASDRNAPRNTKVHGFEFLMAGGRWRGRPYVSTAVLTSD